MKLYQANEHLTDGGYQVVFTEWNVIKETAFYYFCNSALGKKKVHKTNSRVAFRTKKEAFEALVIRKRKHLNHLEINARLIGALVSSLNDMKFNEKEIKNGYGQSFIEIPCTKDKVNELCFFD